MKDFAVLAVLTLVLAGCNETQTSSTSSGSTSTSATGTPGAVSSPVADAATPPAGVPGEVTTPSGLKYVDLVVGSGAEAKSGSDVKVHYTGTFADGREFDGSRDGDPPYAFRIDAGEVIRGWDEGVKGMKVGGRRKIVVPPSLGYGARGYPGAIPPNTTLYFDLELMDVR